MGTGYERLLKPRSTLDYIRIYRNIGKYVGRGDRSYHPWCTFDRHRGMYSQANARGSYIMYDLRAFAWVMMTHPMSGVGSNQC